MTKAANLANIGDSGTIFVNSNANVGVGSTAPTVKLDVSGTVRADAFEKSDGTSIGGGGSGGSGLGTAISYGNLTKTPFSYVDTVVDITADIMLDTNNAGTSNSFIMSVIPNINVNAGVAVTVGVGKTLVIDVLQIGDI